MEVSNKVGAGLVLAFLVQLGALFYWGGTTRQKVDNLQASFTRFSAQAQTTHSNFNSDISDLRVRLSVAESDIAVCQDTLGVF